MEQELEPCPFCGYDPDFRVKEGSYQVACDNWNCPTMPKTEWMAREHAVEGWNRRAE